MRGMGPIVRLEIDDMKHQILHHLADYHGEVAAEIEKQIEYSIENFDFKEIVRECANKAIEEAIKSYFSYGGGSSNIREALFQVFEKGDPDNV
jgi:hypothetical protein